MSTLHPPVNAHDHSQGPDDAPVTVVEYGDFQCPYCGEAYSFVKQIQERYGDRLRFVFREFPIPELHPQAVPAAMTAEFCADAGKFWEAHDLLYENQDSLGDELYADIAHRLGLDVDTLSEALRTNKYAERIQESIDSGLRSGVNGTPCFYVNGQKVDSIAVVPEAIKSVLGG